MVPPSGGVSRRRARRETARRRAARRIIASVNPNRFGPLLAPALCALLASSAHAAEPATTKPRAVAVLFAGDEAADDARQAVVRGIGKAYDRLGGYAVQPAAKTLGHLAEAGDLGIACDLAVTECAARMGTLAAVDEVMRVEVRGDEATLTRIDVAGAAEVGTGPVRGGLADPRAEDAAALAVVQMIDPSRVAAAILVQASEPGIEIFVDGRSQGVTPLDGPLVVAPGVHAIEGRVAGRGPFQQELEIAWGTTTSVDVQLPAAPLVASTEPITEGAGLSPMMWGGGALAIGGGVFAIGAGAALTGIELALSNPTPYDTRSTLATTGKVMTGVTALGVVAAVAGGALIAMEFAGSDG